MNDHGGCLGMIVLCMVLLLAFVSCAVKVHNKKLEEKVRRKAVSFLLENAPNTQNRFDLEDVQETYPIEGGLALKFGGKKSVVVVCPFNNDCYFPPRQQ